MSDLEFRVLSISVSAIIFAFIGYINWYGNIKRDSVRWIGRKISRPLFGDEAIFADGIFMYITGALLVIGIFLIGINF